MEKKFFFGYKRKIKFNANKFNKFINFYKNKYNELNLGRWELFKELVDTRRDVIKKKKNIENKKRFLLFEKRSIYKRRIDDKNRKSIISINEKIENFDKKIKNINKKFLNKKLQLDTDVNEIKRKLRVLNFYNWRNRKYRKFNSKLFHLRLSIKKIRSKFTYYYLREGKKRSWRTEKRLKLNTSFKKVFKRYKWISPLHPWTKTRRPGGGFVPSYFDNKIIVDEFAKSDIPFITLLDSNIVSSNIFIPFPSNDDSTVCVNFFLYLITRAIFVGKFNLLKKWKDKIKLKQKRDFLKKKIYF